MAIPIRLQAGMIAAAGAVLSACGSVVVGIQPVVTAGGTPLAVGGSAPSLAPQYPIGEKIERQARYRETKEAGGGTHSAEQRGIAFEFADNITGVCISGRGQQGSTAPWPAGLDIHVSGRIVGHLALISAVEMVDCTLTPLKK